MDGDQVQNVYGWTPGKVPMMEPSDTAWTLEPGTDLVLLLHMIAGATSETVQPTVGLFFSDTPPTRTPISVKLESKAIDIPAGEANYVVEDSYVLPADVEAVSVYPHAHYLGKEMRGTATLPDGSQTGSAVDSPVGLPLAGPVSLPDRRCSSRRARALSMRFTYDNSAANPNNRTRPPQRVRAGPRSTDEMAQLWLEVVPRRAEDAALLNADFTRRALLADIAAAELERPARSARWPPRTTCSRRSICRRAALPTRRRSSKRRCVSIPATRRRTATSGRCCRRRGGSRTGCSTCARRCS